MLITGNASSNAFQITGLRKRINGLGCRTWNMLQSGIHFVYYPQLIIGDSIFIFFLKKKKEVFGSTECEILYKRNLFLKLILFLFDILYVNCGIHFKFLEISPIKNNKAILVELGSSLINFIQASNGWREKTWLWILYRERKNKSLLGLWHSVVPWTYNSERSWWHLSDWHVYIIGFIWMPI